MLKEFRPALIVLVAFSIITGVLYPAVVTGIAAVALPSQAEGSLVRSGDRIIGSRLIGQAFAGPRYFWSRPSATTPAYNAAASSGSNLGPINPVLDSMVRARVAALHAADPGNTMPVPADLVTASGSGLDPDISPAAAMYQAGRVAHARGLSRQAVADLVTAHVAPRTLGILGEPRVNVLLLNLALDSLGGSR